MNFSCASSVIILVNKLLLPVTLKNYELSTSSQDPKIDVLVPFLRQAKGIEQHTRYNSNLSTSLMITSLPPLSTERKKKTHGGIGLDPISSYDSALNQSKFGNLQEKQVSQHTPQILSFIKFQLIAHFYNSNCKNTKMIFTLMLTIDVNSKLLGKICFYTLIDISYMGRIIINPHTLCS